MHGREFQERVWQTLEQEWQLHGGEAASEDIYAQLIDAGVEVPDHVLNEVFDGWESRGFIRALGFYDREAIRLHGARTIVRGIRGQERVPKSDEAADAANRSTMPPGELPTTLNLRVRHPHDPTRPESEVPDEGQNPPIVPETAPRPDAFDQIRRLAELRDEGLITSEEFEAKKRELLDRL